MISGLWYHAFTAAFVLYQLDVIIYSFIALIARIYEALRPVPGHPWYSFWHKEEYVAPPECDADGFKLHTPSSAPSAATIAAAAAADSLCKQQVHTGAHSMQSTLDFGPDAVQASSASVFARHGWHIPTITAVAGSMAGASSHSTFGSNSTRSIDTASLAASSDCSNSNASGSRPTTPLVGLSGAQHAQLDTIFSINLDDSTAIVGLDRFEECMQQQQQQLEVDLQQQQHLEAHEQQQQQQHEVVVTQLDTQASLPAAPHVSARSLRYRPVGSDDGSHSSAAGGSSSPSSSSRQQRGLHSAAGSSLASNTSSSSSSSSQVSPKKSPLGWGHDLQGSCAAYEPEEQGVLLPLSLVQQYNFFPLVLVQLPMYNEEAHCEVVIERACGLIWPRHRLIIQVCDDSTREDVKRRIDAKVSTMCQRGHNCLVTRRPVNKGFKAGNMINGMQYLNNNLKVPWEYVAVFDADFEMPPDWLYQTVWHLERDKQLAFVQTRWAFTNGYDNLLCWVQQVSLGFHFAVEQRARSFLRTFFGFNGTAGVWRRSAMEQAGGWNMDSTVEDMDLSLRAYLHGWKFRYLHWVSCPNELPPTMSAYKTQQYRWNSGPMVVIKGLLHRIWTTDRVNFLDRLSCTYFFFRFIYSAFLTVICLLCPAIIIWLDPWTWHRFASGWWGPEMTFLVAGNTAAAAFVWFAGLLFWPYFLLQCGVGYFRVYAMVNGLIGSKKSGTWKVTAKFGKQSAGRSGLPKHKPYLLELLLAAGFFAYTACAVWYRVYLLAAFTWVMGWTLLMLSFGEWVF